LIRTGYQTTASWAREEASRPEHAREVELNARLESIAAHDAADAASVCVFFYHPLLLSFLLDLLMGSLIFVVVGSRNICLDLSLRRPHRRLLL
jgi:hypothetical protein